MKTTASPSRQPFDVYLGSVDPPDLSNHLAAFHGLATHETVLVNGLDRFKTDGLV